jgi:hypothetical protein
MKKNVKIKPVDSYLLTQKRKRGANETATEIFTMEVNEGEYRKERKGERR